MDRDRLSAAALEAGAPKVCEELAALRSRVTDLRLCSARFVGVSDELDELDRWLIEAFRAVGRLSKLTDGLVERYRSGDFDRALSRAEMIMVDLVRDERLVMWRGGLSWVVKSWIGGRQVVSHLELSDAQIVTYNGLVERGVIFPPDGHGEFAQIRVVPVVGEVSS